MRNAGAVVLDCVRGKIGAAEYWLAVSEGMSFADQCGGNAEWEARLRESADSGFWRLHALDRSDPFWKGTNGLATESKLHAFAFYELAADPKNVDAACRAIAASLLTGSQHLEAFPWQVLLDGGAADLRFLVGSAYAMAPYWTDFNIGPTCALTRTLGLHARMEEALQWLAAQGEEQAEWTKAVRHALAR